MLDKENTLQGVNDFLHLCQQANVLLISLYQVNSATIMKYNIDYCMVSENINLAYEQLRANYAQKSLAIIDPHLDIIAKRIDLIYNDFKLYIKDIKSNIVVDDLLQNISDFENIVGAYCIEEYEGYLETENEVKLIKDTKLTNIWYEIKLLINNIFMLINESHAISVAYLLNQTTNLSNTVN